MAFSIIQGIIVLFLYALGASVVGVALTPGILLFFKILNAVIMPGCEIGNGAVIGAGAVLLKDTKVEAQDVWFGIPAESMRHKKENEKYLPRSEI